MTSYAAHRDLALTVRGYGAGEVRLTVGGFASRPRVSVDGTAVPTRPAEGGAEFVVHLPDTAPHQVRIMDR